MRKCWKYHSFYNGLQAGLQDGLQADYKRITADYNDNGSEAQKSNISVCGAARALPGLGYTTSETKSLRVYATSETKSMSMVVVMAVGDALITTGFWSCLRMAVGSALVTTVRGSCLLLVLVLLETPLVYHVNAIG